MSRLGDPILSADPGLGTDRVAWSADGRWIVAAGNCVALIDAGSGAVRWSIAEAFSPVVGGGRWNAWTLAVGPAKDVIAVASVSSLLGEAPTRTRISRFEDGEVLWEVDSAASELVFSPNGLLLAMTLGESVRLIDAKTGHDRLALPAHLFMVPAFSSDSRWLATSDGNRVYVHDTAFGRQRWARGDFGGFGNAVRLAFTEDDRHVVAASDRVVVLDAEDGAPQTNVILDDAPEGPIFVLDRGYALSQDRLWVAKGGTRGLRAWRVADGLARFGTIALAWQPFFLDAIHGDRRVCFSPDGRLIAINATLPAESLPAKPLGATLIDATTGEGLWTAAEWTDVAFGPEGDRFAVCGGSVHVYSTGKE